MNTEVATANTQYLKQLVKLDAKSAMPDAQSFAAQTAVERVPSMESKVAVNATPAAAIAAAGQNVWQTNVESPPPPATVAFKGPTR
jgi:hypothetical protein